MRCGWRGILLATLLLFAVGGAASPAAGRAAVPAGFFGTVSQGPLEGGEMARMEGVVGTLRIPIYWAGCEPSPGAYEFAGLDAEIGAAVEHGIRVQPFVYGTPAAYSPDPMRPPLAGAARVAWRKFLVALVGRYGSRGSFWVGRARREPVRVWQVWNEPNFSVFWQPRPDPTAYARLLASSAPVIRTADRRARVALAGVAPVGDGLPTWTFLRRLFRVPGVRGDFDLVSLHPYSASIAQLNYAIEKVRRVMVRAGLGARPLLVSELGVASGGDPGSVFVMGRAGQAQFLAEAFRRLLQMRDRWHVAGVDWFSLQDNAQFDPYCSFCQGSGLFELGGAPKPAWSVFRHIALAAAHWR
jgi:hypothetical protein